MSQKDQDPNKLNPNRAITPEERDIIYAKTQDKLGRSFDQASKSSLPSREEIKKERERRRLERIKELERLSSIEEVEKTHRHSNITNDNYINKNLNESFVSTSADKNFTENITASDSIFSKDELLTNDPEIQSDESINSNEVIRSVPLTVSSYNEDSANHEDNAIVPVILPPTDSDPIVSDDSVDSDLQRKQNENPYSLKELDTTSKIIFSFNVFFNVLKKFAIYILLAALLFSAMAGGIGIGYFAYLVSQTPPPTKEVMAEQINRVDQQSSLYYANGEQIASVRSDIVRTVTELEDISPYIIDGLIATEDEYFYEHPGVVPKAILRATLQELISSGTGTGGSTLTQQLVKQQLLSNDVTFFRKANEILLALRVENYFSKDEILTAYLNISSFGRNNSGDNIAGIRSASTGIFGKEPNEVNLPQAAFLVGLPQAPYNYTPYNQYGEILDDLSSGIDRMKDVLFRMYRTEKITKDEYEQAISYDISKDFIPTVTRSEERQTYLYQSMMNGAIEQIMRLNIADRGLTWDQVNADVDWFNEFYFEAEKQLRTGGYHVYTTIDKNIYDTLNQSALTYKDQLGASYDGIYTDPDTGEETYYVESVQSGVVVIDNPTGRVLGFVAGTDFENNQIDHAFGMHRSPGSTIKPLAVYAPAIEHNMINPSTIIPDTAFELVFEDGSTWTPTNYGGVVSNTFMTARTALLRSDNLPAVRIYEKIVDNNIPVFDYLQKMSFDINDSYTEQETNNLAFSLGGVTKGPTVFEQTSAFTTFANNGQYIDGYYIDRIEDAFGNIVYQHNVDPVKVFSEDTNYLVLDMLRDTNTQGTGRTAASLMAMGGDWIAKSGISENSRDVWYIASTPKITIGTWIGYDNRYIDYYIDINDGFDRESVRIQTYWSNLVNELYEQYPNIFGTEETFLMPESVQETAIVQSTGTLPGTINVNGVNVSIAQPLVNEIFKVSNPAKVLSYDFIFNASESETQTFWAGYIAQAQEALRRQREAQNASNSSSDDESKEDEDENSNEESDSSTQENNDSNS